MTSTRIEWTYNGGVVTKLGGGGVGGGGATQAYAVLEPEFGYDSLGRVSAGGIGTGKGLGLKGLEEQTGYLGRKSLDSKLMEEEERRERRRRQKAKVVNCCKKFIAFLFSHIGLAGMVVAYSILGGFIFKEIEAPYERKVKHEVIEYKRTLVESIHSEAIRLHNGTVNSTEFSRAVHRILVDFQERVYLDVKEKGWDGTDDHEEADLQWSFAGALLFSVTVITTIGYGHIAPKTKLGRFVTILYALVGIPLTFLYLSNIGNFLADCFRLFYKKICCDVCCCQKCERDKQRNRIRARRLKLAQQRNMLLAQRYSLGVGGELGEKDSLCHSLDEITVSPVAEAEQARGFHRSASAPKMCLNSLALPNASPPLRSNSQRDTVSPTRNSNTTAPHRPSGGSTLPRRTGAGLKPPSLEAPPPYNRPTPALRPSRPPSYRQSVTSTDRLLPQEQSDIEASGSDMGPVRMALDQVHANSGPVRAGAEQVRETAILDSDTDEETTAGSTVVTSPTLSATFFSRFNDAKETAIVDMAEEGNSMAPHTPTQTSPDPNMLSPPDITTTTAGNAGVLQNSHSRTGSNRSAQSKSSYTDDIEGASLVDISIEPKSKSRRSRKDKAKEDKNKDKGKKSKSKEKKKEKESIDMSSSRNKQKKDRSTSKTKRSKSERRRNKDDARKEKLSTSESYTLDLRKSSTQSEPTQHTPNQVSFYKKKSKESKNGDSSGMRPNKTETSFSAMRSQTSRESGKSNEDSLYRGSVESFVTAYSESSMCTQEETDDEAVQIHPRNGDVIKPQPGSHGGPAVSFRGNAIDLAHPGLGGASGTGRGLNYRHTISNPNHLRLSYMDDSLDFDDDDGEKVTVPIPVCLIIIAGYIFAGSVLFTLWEDWDYLTGSYFCFVTLSTIGFGDIVPGMKMDEWASHEKLVLCALWLAFGLSLLAMCFNLMQEEVKEKVKWVGNKIGLLKDETQT